MGLEQSPAYFTTRENSRNRARSLSHPRSISGRDRQRSRETSISPVSKKAHRVPPRRRDSISAFNDRGRSRSPSSPRVYPVPIFKRQMSAMPVEHSKFIWDTVSYISNLQAFFDFATCCGIPSCIV